MNTSTPITTAVKVMVCGYHKYRYVWNTEIREEFLCIHEKGNSQDPFAVATRNENCIVSHVQCKISVAYSVILAYCSLDVLQYVRLPGDFLLKHFVTSSLISLIIVGVSLADNQLLGDCDIEVELTCLKYRCSTITRLLCIQIFTCENVDFHEQKFCGHLI